MSSFQLPGAGPSAPPDERRPLEEYERILADAEQLLDAVDRALVRIREGTYRTCEACGQPIGDERLVAEPTTRLCHDHAPADPPDRLS